MNFWQDAWNVHNRNELSSFLAAASRDFAENPEAWENSDIASFLEAMGAWVQDCDGVFVRNGEPLPSADAWATVAKAVAAARVYE
ncbi:hypothetical protein ACIQMP_00675 [Streptomyces sp. NPDC091385]|uniref:DUF7660 family protein n=1 Tax=Streptomyces sp. NPDC091385 TaxID=3365997 RepID=UPI0037FEF8A5